MADAKATLAVSLEDKASAPAGDAADALEALRDRIVASQNAMRDMSAAMGRLKGPSAEVAAQRKLLADRLTAERTKLAEAQAGYLKLGGALGEIGKKTAAAKTGLAAIATGSVGATEKSAGLSGALQRLGLPLGELGDKGSAVSEILGGSSGLGIALGAVGAAAALVVVAFAAAVVAIGALAVKMADGARSARIYLQALGGGVAGGAALGASIDSVAKKVALEREELKGLASDLFLAGLKGADLTSALESVAMVQATIGAGPAAKLKSALEAASKTGSVVVKDLEAIGLQGKYTFEELRKAVNDRFGAAAEAQLISLPNLLNRAKVAASGVFSGLNIDPVLKALDAVLKLFEENGVAGRALRKVMESVFQPLFDSIGKNQKVVTAFFKGATIAALMFVLVVLKLKNALKGAFEGTGIDPFTAALMLGAMAAMLFLVPLIVLGTWATVLATLIMMPVTNIIALANAFKAGYDKIVELGWGDIATNIIDGIVSGIKAGAAKVVGAITDMGNAALEAGKKVFEIASPSRKFRRDIGRQLPAGAAGGVEDGTPQLKAAVVSMGRAAIDTGAAAVEGGGSSARRGKASGASVSVGELHLHLEGVRDVETFKARARPALIELFRELSHGGFAPAL
jgi:hypothetical protein